MGFDRLAMLYQAVIMEHAGQPANRRALEEATHHMELLNPSCGDVIQVQLQVKDGIIEDVGFVGSGCAISMASASLMTLALKKQPLERAELIISEFMHLVGGPEPKGPERLSEEELKEAIDDAYLLEGVKQFPARYMCATLAWQAVHESLNDSNKGDNNE